MGFSPVGMNRKIAKFQSNAQGFGSKSWKFENFFYSFGGKELA